MSNTSFCIYPESDKVVRAWAKLPDSHYKLTPADLAELRSCGSKEKCIPAAPGDIMIFKKFVVHGSVKVAAGDGTRFTTYAQFQLSKRSSTG